MPNMFGGDQLSEDYAPWFHEFNEVEEDQNMQGKLATEIRNTCEGISVSNTHQQFEEVVDYINRKVDNMKNGDVEATEKNYYIVVTHKMFDSVLEKLESEGFTIKDESKSDNSPTARGAVDYRYKISW